MAVSFTLDGFEIGNRIGAGGFGEVWEARQIGVDRPVAIKVGNTRISDATDQLRFERECKALGRLSTHANIVTVYTSGQLPDGRPILVLEYVDGDTLQKWALSNPSTEAQIMNIGADLASALVEAHSHQILHRDLKPQNVLLRTNGEAILADFGIAQLQDGLRTVTGNVTASAAYAAPEVLDGKRATEQSDIYGIGICMLAAATQSTPFTDADDTTLYPVLTRVLTAEPPDITTFGYSAPFNDLVQRLLQKDPAARFNNAAEVLTELRRLNVGPDSYQRVTPVAKQIDGGEARGGASVSNDPPTQGPEITPGSGQLVQHAPVPQPAAQPVPQPAQPVAPAPQPVAQVPAAAEQPAPATVAVPDQAPPTVGPPLQGYTPTPTVPVGADTASPAAAVGGAVPAAGGMAPAKLAAIIGGILVAALALFFAFGRGGGDDSTAQVQTSETTQTTASETNESQSSETQSNPTESNESESSEPAPGGSEDDSSDREPAAASPPREPFPADDPVQVTGSIDIALDFRDYPVEMLAGQEVSVQVTAMNGRCDGEGQFDLEILVLDPQGNELGGQGSPDIWGCKGFAENWMAEVDGVYTVRMASGGTPPATGTFDATIATLKRTRADGPQAGSIDVTAVIDRAHDSISYEVDLASGQAASIGMTSINGSCNGDDYFGLKFGFFDPSGSQVGDIESPAIWGCDASGRWAAEVDGVHTLVFFSDDDTGAFEASLGLPESAIEALDSSERIHEISGTISIPRDDINYEIELAAGQQVSVDLTSMNGSCDGDDYFGLRMQLVDPSGQPIGDEGNASIWGCKAFGPWAAAVDGTHRVQFFDDDGDVGDFTATIGRLGG